MTPVSWLERTPTYKEKKAAQPDDVNHGLLTYPILQAADIVMYKASLVPVGKDQAAHLELSREIVRAFNARYGDTFPEPMAVFTEAPVVLGTDGVRKMSKSVGNTIDVLAEPPATRKQVLSIVTDTKRILFRHLAEVCNVYNSTGSSVMTTTRSGTASDCPDGCVDTKKPCRRIIAHYAPARSAMPAHGPPGEVAGILGRAPTGCTRSRRRRWPRSASGWACGESAVIPAEPAGLLITVRGGAWHSPNWRQVHTMPFQLTDRERR